MKLGHIRSAEHLGGWLKGRGLNHLIFNTKDLSGIDPGLAESLYDVVEMTVEKVDGLRERPIHDRWQALFPRGHVMVPTAMLCDGRFSVNELAAIQNIVEAYMDYRRGQGRPSKTEPCPSCGPRGVTVKSCRYCAGEGETITLLEMDALETHLAATGAYPAEGTGPTTRGTHGR